MFLKKEHYIIYIYKYTFFLLLHIIAYHWIPPFTTKPNVPFCKIFKEHYGTLGGKKGTLPFLQGYKKEH